MGRRMMYDVCMSCTYVVRVYTHYYMYVCNVKHVMICGDGTRRMSCVAIFFYLFTTYTLHVVRVVPGTCVVLKCTYMCIKDYRVKC